MRIDLKDAYTCKEAQLYKPIIWTFELAECGDHFKVRLVGAKHEDGQSVNVDPPIEIIHRARRAFTALVETAHF